ncbi:DUF1207 domain-containing protein [Bacteroidota bacterium]
MITSRYFSLLFLFLFLIAGFGNGRCQESDGQFSLLDRGMYFKSIILDPAECQNYGGLLKLWDSEGKDEGIYIPVNIGFRQSLARYDFNEKQGFEFGIEAAVFTQFTIKKVEANTYLGEMENTDYKLSFLLNYRYNSISLRARAFHVSSHLADDYILRNQITSPNDGSLNYEQFDLTGSIQKEYFRYYGGLGMVITPHAVRDRFSSQLGTFFRRPGNNPGFLRYIGGLDIKIFEQNDFTPNIRTGIGIELGPPEKTRLAFMIEYYNGHLPYSTLEYKKVQWLGISAFILATRK